MAKVKVRTDQGPVTVTTRLNKAGQVTGRVDGVTYAADTWREVEEQIRKKYEGRPPFHKYLAVKCVRVGNRIFTDDISITDEPTETHGVAVCYEIWQVSDVCKKGATKGRWVIDEDDLTARARFRVGVETEKKLQATYASDTWDPVRLVKWSQELQDELDLIIGRLRELAGALDKLLALKNLPELAAPRMFLALEDPK